MNSTEFKNGLNVYYQLKSQYEENLRKEKKKIIGNANLSWKEKRIEFKKLRPKCINCKRPVGTYFSTTFNKEEDGRIAKALCGSKTDPCPLDIEINLGTVLSIQDFLNTDETDIGKLKNTIIKDKNDLLFGYITAESAIQKFDALKEELSRNTSSYEINLEKFMFQSDNLKKREILKKLQLDILADIASLKKAVNDYDRSQDVQFVNDAVTLYIEQLLPKVEQRRELVYPYNSVECANDICTLIQKKITIEQMEDNYSVSDIGVKKIEMGTKKPQRQRLQEE